MNQPPSVVSGSDQTAAGDAEVRPLLDAAEADLRALADQVQTLGTRARGALAALNGADAAAVEAAIAEGDRLVADVATRSASIRSDLAAIPYVGLGRGGSERVRTRGPAACGAGRGPRRDGRPGCVVGAPDRRVRWQPRA